MKRFCWLTVVTLAAVACVACGEVAHDYACACTGHCSDGWNGSGDPQVICTDDAQAVVEQAAQVCVDSLTSKGCPLATCECKCTDSGEACE